MLLSGLSNPCLAKYPPQKSMASGGTYLYIGFQHYLNDFQRGRTDCIYW